MIDNDSNLSAILGATNTGKTHIAFEKMLSYSSGVFGFPLRLLARENYDKACKTIGLNNVALITGEEKIFPKEAKYFFCTVESMPTEINVECVVIDEVQLAADYERGHIFTDRILNLRGTQETIFLGSSIIESILKKLFPNINILRKERLSELLFNQKQNLSKLKPRSAIIAFNINNVYEIAERIRTHKGGAAVVLGSLSPRTRNAQVEIYENKNVDYLVATDAIGMGLNLKIDHVCFTSLEKFDGRYNRNLSTNEIGQIAGRAGRYKNNGTFGYTKEAGLLDPIIIKSIENHNYDQLQKIYWRNSNLIFDTVESLLVSLKQIPLKNFLIQKKNAIDEINFKTLAEDDKIRSFLSDSFHIKLLWDICRIPDFEKIFNDNYITFLKTIFLTLLNNNYKIPEDWLNNKIARLENFNGGIPELSIKISQIRTWTYISNQNDWLINPLYWQDKTQRIENQLSDNLHIGLTNKFVDSSSKFFTYDSFHKNIEKIDINRNNEIVLDEEKYGVIKGFDIQLSKNLFSHSLFSLSHVKKSLRNMIEEKIKNFLNSPDDSLNLGDISKIKFNASAFVFWGDEPIGKLIKGSKVYLPQAEALNSEFLSSENKLLVSLKIQKWIDNLISNNLKPIKDKLDENLNSHVRAIAFNCFENLGMYPIENFTEFLKNIDKDNKLSLSQLGIRVGAKYFFMPNLLKKKPIELCALLWRIYNQTNINNYLPLPSDGRVSFQSTLKLPETYWQSIGYILLNDFAFRVDVFEKIFYLARKKIKSGPFLESSEFMNPIGCNSDQLKDILEYCGYESTNLPNDRKLYFFKTKHKKKYNKKNIKKDINIVKKQKKTNIANKADPNSPFAVLEKLL